ncbi:Uncharacterised protein [Shigella sonnei]|nr:Uncharacterised protein [Shigella sonnei]
MNVFSGPVSNRGQFVTNHFQRLTRYRTQMFFRRIGIELSKIFVEITAALCHLFQRLAAFAQQFHQISQLRAVTGIDIFLLNVPL